MTSHIQKSGYFLALARLFFSPLHAALCNPLTFSLDISIIFCPNVAKVDHPIALDNLYSIYILLNFMSIIFTEVD
jgi:hypothetical protein